MFCEIGRQATVIVATSDSDFPSIQHEAEVKSLNEILETILIAD